MTSLPPERIAELRALAEDHTRAVAFDRETIISLLSALEERTKALESIAANTCCGPCQEAKLVARAALAGQKERA